MTRSIQRFKALARRIVEVQESTGMFGLSTRKCGSPLLVRRGTSPASTASRWTLLNAKSGTARTPLPFYLSEAFPFQPAAHSQLSNAQKPKVSIRWQPLDPKYIGALTLRGSYTEAFHAPALSEISPASTQSFGIGFDEISNAPYSYDIRVIGNPNLKPEVAYEWSYGAVYSPKWIKGLTLSADWWHIDMRSITSFLGVDFVIQNNIPGLIFRGPPPRVLNGGLVPGLINLVVDPNENPCRRDF